jgi:hypothetical protein
LWERFSVVSKVITQKFRRLAIKNASFSSVFAANAPFRLWPGRQLYFTSQRKIQLTDRSFKPFFPLTGNTLNSSVSLLKAIEQP